MLCRTATAPILDRFKRPRSWQLPKRPAGFNFGASVDMRRREVTMTVPHEQWLVVLSVCIAIQGSFVGLLLARGLDQAEGFRRRVLLAGASMTLATGVWSMHFVGMLAADFPSAIDYLVLPTLLSFLICVIVVGIGVYAAHADGSPILRISAGAVAMGLGICLMHYVGMSAVHLAGPTSQETPFVGL